MGKRQTHTGDVTIESELVVLSESTAIKGALTIKGNVLITGEIVLDGPLAITGDVAFLKGAQVDVSGTIIHNGEVLDTSESESDD